ncbi:transketolase-like TK C-terminal-containing protein [Allosalinactinospora lopnorensis]|uniref:transketolase-like TK C-terminal-containing protein n=1 Tax=Allosalinactinospora lopnorensis TaxID=1352348 RepID=UPI00373FC67B
MPDVALAASGSEVAVALAAAELLAEDGLAARVVSVPWRERFRDRLDAGCAPVPADCPAVWIEAGSTTGWHALARPGDRVVGLDDFGASAPGPVLMRELGLTPEAVATAASAAAGSPRRTSTKERG